ncbi:hypothetical protein MSG28_010638 [Choristoneura fumiferana]|uniref:Uncharacterized protein n=1 Tax=Choristoneura fumiferana TaxID=7141 RepID=A0ACC0KNT0_CHOFU|nr:hypothetical protein MSG28_010638 [Choristoneura fumiferana]
MKVLRKILGPVKRDDGTWRIRKNREIQELVAEPNIIGVTKSHRLRWFGHLLRMGEDRAAKRAYVGRPAGRRPVGRPRCRWEDSVQADLRRLQVEDWQEAAHDRDRWHALVSEAKTLFGSLSQIISSDGTCTKTNSWISPNSQCVRSTLTNCNVDNSQVAEPCARSAQIATTILLANPAVKQQCLHCCVSAWRVRQPEKLLALEFQKLCTFFSSIMKCLMLIMALAINTVSSDGTCTNTNSQLSANSKCDKSTLTNCYVDKSERPGKKGLQAEPRSIALQALRLSCVRAVTLAACKEISYNIAGRWPAMRPSFVSTRALGHGLRQQHPLRSRRASSQRDTRARNRILPLKRKRAIKHFLEKVVSSDGTCVSTNSQISNSRCVNSTANNCYIDNSQVETTTCARSQYSGANGGCERWCWVWACAVSRARVETKDGRIAGQRPAKLYEISLQAARVTARRQASRSACSAILLGLLFVTQRETVKGDGGGEAPRKGVSGAELPAIKKTQKVSFGKLDLMKKTIDDQWNSSKLISSDGTCVNMNSQISNSRCVDTTATNCYIDNSQVDTTTCTRSQYSGSNVMISTTTDCKISNSQILISTCTNSQFDGIYMTTSTIRDSLSSDGTCVNTNSQITANSQCVKSTATNCYIDNSQLDTTTCTGSQYNGANVLTAVTTDCNVINSQVYITTCTGSQYNGIYIRSSTTTVVVY